ncbi:threonine--tRNA ligase [bacterium]|nr:threonine--tRNA ligase [bacterium]|tara:strand:- start:11907 stop:13631 length:1725 start_codon:yes stop_codon:yes gene_type:complete
MINKIENMRHTASHVLAQAVLRLFPDVKLGIGPVIQDGFYYDFLFGREFSEDDFLKIEEEMHRIVKDDYKLEKFTLSREKALEELEGQPFKQELVMDIPESEEISFYKQGEFTDLCEGKPSHVASTSQIGKFKILSTSGAYWKGNENNVMLQRIYATSFEKKSELKAYLDKLKEAEKRDHRRIGQKLNLFEIFSQDAGSGLVFWLPQGKKLLNSLMEWSRSMHVKDGYREIETPHIVHTNLWEKSGHLANFKDFMFICPDDEGDSGVGIKPMNCPGHMLVYSRKRRSYKELPVKLMEFGTVYRNEKAGTMHGLFRVRGFTQDDAHIFCTFDQLENQIIEVLNFAESIFSKFGFKWKLFFKGRPDKSIGSDAAWEKAESSLKAAISKAGIDAEYIPGDGAFYGPKLDFEIEDALGRHWQCTTVQIDFNLPDRFNLSYVNSNDEEEVPVLIHRAIFGSMERFIGILIEHYAGNFPFWLSPTQAIIVPISEKHFDYGREFLNDLKSAGIRAKLDDRNEKVGKKIRDAELNKVPYMFVVGDREMNSSSVSVRHRDDGDRGSVSKNELIEELKKEGNVN